MIVASLLRTAAACLAAATAGRRLWRSRGYGHVAPGPDDVSLDHGDSAYHGPRAEQLIVGLFGNCFSCSAWPRALVPLLFTMLLGEIF